MSKRVVIYILSDSHKHVRSYLLSQFYYYNSNIITFFLLLHLLTIYTPILATLSKKLLDICTYIYSFDAYLYHLFHSIDIDIILFV